MSKVNNLINKYYSIIPKEDLQNIRNKVLCSQSQEERKNILNEQKSKIEKLREIFTELVNERNDLAKRQGYDNYFQYIAQWDGIPKSKLNGLETKIAKSSKSILSKLEENFNLPDWYFSTYHFFNLSDFFSTYAFQLPDELVQRLNIANEELARIIFRHRNGNINESQFDIESGKTLIYYNKQSTSIDSAILLAHEIGHARKDWTSIKKDKRVTEFTTYQEEEAAIEAEYEFTKTLNPQERILVKDRVLYSFSKTLFEKYVYEKRSPDPDQAFAKAYSNILGKQVEPSPFYLFNNFLIEAPCYSTVYTAHYLRQEE